MAELSFNINGVRYNPPVESRDIDIIGAWINGMVQPNIVSQEFTFVGEAAQYILDYIEAGKTTGPGIFRGLPFTIEADDIVDGNRVVWDGMIDFLGGYEVILPNKVKVKITRPDDIDRFDKRLSAISYGYLREKGEITAADYVGVMYVVRKVNNSEGMITLIVTEFILVKEFLSTMKDWAAIIGKLSTGLLWEIITAVFYIIYIIVLVITIVKMAYEILFRILPPPRIQAGMTLRKLLEKACTHLGYTFNSNIKELDTIVYIPSRATSLKPRLKDYIKGSNGNFNFLIGIPTLSDFGYKCNDMFGLCSDLFNAQIKIDKGVVYFYSENDNFWTAGSGYVMPDVLLDNYTYNIQDAVSTRLFSFQTDSTDEWTIADFTGTNYEVDLKSSQTIEQKYIVLKGYKELRWPVSLASRKGILDELEEFVNTRLLQAINGGNPLATAAFNTLMKLVPKKKRPAIRNAIFQGIDVDLGVVQISTNNWAMPKLVNWTNRGVPKNHRDNFSARSLWNKYHSYRSFGPPYTGQRIVYKDIKIPFGLHDYIKLLNNSYFSTADGKRARFTDLKWNMMHDWAVVSFEVYEPYIKSLTETTFEP